MDLSSPSEARSRGQFWLALLLSTVTALAVTFPLAFRAADAGDPETPASPGATSRPATSANVEPTSDLPEQDSADREPTVDETTTSTSSIPAIAVRPDVDTELVIRSGTDPGRAETTTTSPDPAVGPRSSADTAR